MSLFFPSFSILFYIAFWVTVGLTRFKSFLLPFSFVGISSERFSAGISPYKLPLVGTKSAFLHQSVSLISLENESPSLPYYKELEEAGVVAPIARWILTAGGPGLEAFIHLRAYTLSTITFERRLRSENDHVVFRFRHLKLSSTATRYNTQF